MNERALPGNGEGFLMRKSHQRLTFLNAVTILFYEVANAGHTRSILRMQARDRNYGPGGYLTFPNSSVKSTAPAMRWIVSGEWISFAP